jgi:secreted trypsin-like serine protease
MRVMRPWLFAGILLTGCQGGVIGDSTSSDEDAIIGGVNDNSDPAVVMLRKGGGFCTGTLVTPTRVLTAAHCAAVGPTEVGFGIQGNLSRVRVAKVVADSRFNGQKLNNGFDVAVLTLSQAVPASVATPVAFNRDTRLLPTKIGAQVRIVGFGNNTSGVNGTGFGFKREASVKINSVDSKLVGIGQTGTQKCNGDSGGPTFLKVGTTEVLTGVTSFGFVGCTGGGFDSRVDAYLDFIDQQIPPGDNQPPPNPGTGDQTPPTISVVSPADGSQLRSGVTRLVADARDDVALKDVVLTWTIPSQGRVVTISCANPIAGVSCVKSGSTHTFSLNVGTGDRELQFAAEDTSGNRTVTDPVDLTFSQ